MEASYTPQLSHDFYSPHIASVLDIARLLDSFHVARYQYIPALGSQHVDRLEQTRNAAPSFHNPKSVLVAARPAVEQARPPPLHAVDPTEIYCARRATLVLPVEGVPPVFSTDYAHDVTLRLTGADGRAIDLPAMADAVLRDDPTVTNPATLSVEQMPDSPEALARSAVRRRAVAKEVDSNDNQTPPGDVGKEDAGKPPMPTTLPPSP